MEALRHFDGQEVIKGRVDLRRLIVDPDPIHIAESPDLADQLGEGILGPPARDEDDEPVVLPEPDEEKKRSARDMLSRSAISRLIGGVAFLYRAARWHGQHIDHDFYRPSQQPTLSHQMVPAHRPLCLCQLRLLL